MRRARGPDGELEARIASFELAFRMQTEAPEMQDISRRVAGHAAALRARRSRDGRFRHAVPAGAAALGARACGSSSATSAAGMPTATSRPIMRSLARAIDKPIAGLLTDLKARGLLDDTLVIWGGEFGRTPTCEGADGRDHNPHGYTMWLAGGGVKAGLTWGKTDDYGYFAVEDKVHVHDLHATILHLLGLDHKRLTLPLRRPRFPPDRRPRRDRQGDSRLKH